MKHNPSDEQHASDDCGPALTLGRHSYSARELSRNGEEQERDAGEHENGRDWRILQRRKSTFHRPISECVPSQSGSFEISSGCRERVKMLCRLRRSLADKPSIHRECDGLIADVIPTFIKYLLTVANVQPKANHPQTGKANYSYRKSRNPYTVTILHGLPLLAGGINGISLGSKNLMPSSNRGGKTSLRFEPQ
jgi:hypothetical protein